MPPTRRWPFSSTSAVRGSRCRSGRCGRDVVVRRHGDAGYGSLRAAGAGRDRRGSTATTIVPCSCVGTAHPAPVAQRIEHRPPEPVAQVRVLPGAPRHCPGRREDGPRKRAGSVHSPWGGVDAAAGPVAGGPTSPPARRLRMWGLAGPGAVSLTHPAHINRHHTPTETTAHHRHHTTDTTAHLRQDLASWVTPCCRPPVVLRPSRRRRRRFFDVDIHGDSLPGLSLPAETSEHPDRPPPGIDRPQCRQGVIGVLGARATGDLFLQGAPGPGSAALGPASAGVPRPRSR